MILATIKQFNQKQLILVQGEYSKKGHLIYLTRKGSFQVILYKMIRFLSGKLKKHMKLAKIAKISIFVNQLVFPERNGATMVEEKLHHSDPIDLI